MKQLLLAICFATLPGLVHSAEPFFGMFSNEEEGFYVKRLILIEDGKCLFQGIPALWKRDPQTDEFTLTFPTGNPDYAHPPLKLRFDAAKREFMLLDPKIAEGTRPMHLVSTEIPAAVRARLKRFDGTIKSFAE